MYTPLGGITDAALVRDLLDLDAWLSMDKMQAKTLPDTHALIWDTIVSKNLCTGSDATGSHRYYLPESLTNSRKVQFSSPMLSRPAPTAIAPFDSESKQKIILQMFAEIGMAYGIYGGQPSFSRTCATEVTSDDSKKRLVIFGGSHASRITEKLANLGAEVENYAQGGWVLTKQSSDPLIAKIAGLKLGESDTEDTVILDLLSNSFLGGTDKDGLPVAPKRKANGKYHIAGEVCLY